MSAVKSKEAYIRNLKTRRNNDIHYLQATRNISRLSRQYNHFSNVIGRNLRNDITPQSAIMQHNRDIAKDFNEQSYNALAQASLDDAIRRDQFDERIAHEEFVKDELIRQEKERKAQEKRQMIGAIGQVGGTILGAGVGMMAGNPMAGAMIGSGVGGMLGGVVGNAPKDYQMVVEGLGTTVGGFAHLSHQNTIKKAGDSFNQFIPHLSKLSEQELWGLFQMYQTKNFNGMNEFYETVKVRQ